MNVLQQLLAMCLIQGHDMHPCGPIYSCASCHRRLGKDESLPDDYWVNAALMPCVKNSHMPNTHANRGTLIEWINANGGL